MNRTVMIVLLTILGLVLAWFDINVRAQGNSIIQLNKYTPMDMEQPCFPGRVYDRIDAKNFRFYICHFDDPQADGVYWNYVDGFYGKHRLTAKELTQVFKYIRGRI